MSKVRWLRATGAAALAVGVLGLLACPGPSSNGQGTTTPRLSTAGGAAQSEPSEPVEPGDEVQQGPGTGQHIPGQFDYYVLSLSWSPQFCATRGKQARPDDPQCGVGASFGFVLHGLWPQYSARGYPESCSVGTTPDAALVQRMLRIMPSPRLIQHEWDKHGTCSGLPAEQYFANTEQLMAGVQIPPRYRAPTEPLRTSLSSLRAELLAQNPALPQDGSSVAVVCQGEFLQEVRLCYEKDFRPRPCSGTVADSCPASELTVRPIMSRP